MYKLKLALNNLQCLICHQTTPNQTLCISECQYTDTYNLTEDECHDFFNLPTSMCIIYPSYKSSSNFSSVLWILLLNLTYYSLN